ncbi:MAG: hypothetical protein HGB19_08730 [Chlorobiales bacterium]|jgi:tRNA (guanine-N7-)-methyltransferase|nr:hypothetical protein [Chlorobiales bacterium]
MGRGRHPARIHVKPPDEAIAQKHLLNWNRRALYFNPETFPKISSQSMFGNDRQLQMDIGSATGEFICSLAKKHPEVNFLGVEVATKPVYKSIKHAVALGLDNIKFILTDFRLLYPLLLPESLWKVYFHFPVPILKKVDSKYKVYSPEFLGAIYAALRPGGLLSVMSDMPEYYQLMYEEASNDARYELIIGDDACPEIEPEDRSHYHRVWDSQGRETYRFLMKKPEQS